MVQGIPDRIINRAFADFSSFDMRNRDTKRQSDRCGSQHFVTVSDHKESGRMCPNRSLRLNVATPIVFAMPMSVLELKRHSTRASILNPSFSIS